MNTELAFKMLNTGIVLVDDQKQILRFSSLIERDFLLQPHDVNRALTTVGPRLPFVDLAEMIDGLDKSVGHASAEGKIDGRHLVVEARRVPVGPPGSEAHGTLIIFRWS